MTIDLTFGEGEAILVVWGADGNVLLSDHAEASNFQSTLPTTQDYHIMVKGRPVPRRSPPRTSIGARCAPPWKAGATDRRGEPRHRTHSGSRAFVVQYRDEDAALRAIRKRGLPSISHSDLLPGQVIVPAGAANPARIRPRTLFPATRPDSPSSALSVRTARHCAVASV